MDVLFTESVFNNSNVIKADRAFIVELNHCTVNKGSVEVSNGYWINIHNNTIMRGNGSTTFAVKPKNMIHTELYDDSVIDGYVTGVDASEGWNHNVSIYNKGTIQSCYTGIYLKGGMNNAYGYDWGMIYMDCSRMLDNLTAIRGEDILFNMYARGNGTNIFTRMTASLGFMPATHQYYFDALFKCRTATDVWLHGGYWDGFDYSMLGNAVNTPHLWSFRKKPVTCHPGYGEVAWDGTLHIHEPNWWNGAVITDPNHSSVVNCGGLTLRSPEQERNDLMAQNTIIFADGQYRNVKIQQDAAWEQLRLAHLPAAEALFAPIARVSNQLRDTTNAVVKHYIDVARVMAVRGNTNSGGFAKLDYGWLPEATVSFDKTDKNQLKMYPNPATDFCRIELKAGLEYEINVFDALGKKVKTLEANADMDLDIKDWQSGIYTIQVLNKTAHQRTFGKIVIQH